MFQMPGRKQIAKKPVRGTTKAVKKSESRVTRSARKPTVANRKSPKATSKSRVERSAVQRTLVNQSDDSEEVIAGESNQGLAVESIHDIDDIGNASDDELPTTQQQSVSSEVGNHLEEKVIEKIVQGRYVHFSSLLPNNKEAGKLVVDGGMLATTSTNRRLYNFSEWLDAFIIYSSVRGSAHPMEAVPMLKYLQVIKRIQGRNGNFVKYDEAFRAKHRGSAMIPWQQVDSEELSWAMNDPSYTPYEELRRRNFQRPQQNYTRTPSANRQPTRRTYVSTLPTIKCCYAYNDGAQCSPTCKYPHVCRRCGKKHRITACNQKPGMAGDGK